MRSVIREEQVFDSDFVSPEEHEGLHDRDLYSELTYLNGKVYSVDEWRDVTKVFKVSNTVFIRSGKHVSQTIKSIYDYDTGTSIIATVTGTINRSNGKVVNIEYDRNFDMEGI